MAKAKARETGAEGGEKMRFQAEVSRLLDIVANSLYSEKEVFLRELISNASDACDRLRYEALTRTELTAGDPDFHIDITIDKDARTLAVADNGIGMNRDDLVENLGTIARSGTSAFLEQLGKDDKSAVSVIGQFGVGFYAAYMVAERVEVTSRRAGEDATWRWTSDGRGEFTVERLDGGDARDGRGTSVVLHLRKSEDEFLEPARIRTIVKTYSDHIPVPIRLDAGEGKPTETLNQASALWARPKSEITDQQYKEFYHHVAHAMDDPWLTLHFRAEGVIEYTGLVFVPSTRPVDIFHPDRRHGVKLYVKRVFITDECEGLLPSWLRFLRGVIDSEDLPLNISREMLQNNPVLAKIRAGLSKRVLGELTTKAEKAPEEYATFWDNFGAVLKEGLYESFENREQLLKLARFRTTRGEGLSSLADYVGRMVEGQDAIYTIGGEEVGALQKSPQIEGFRARGVEVLLLTDPIDEFWVQTVGLYDGKPFRSVTRGGADLSKIKPETAEDAAADKTDDAVPAAGIDDLIALLKLTLGDAVKEVRASDRLTDSAVCLVADEGDLDMHLERLLKQHKQLDQTFPRILEINPKHKLIRQLAGKAKAGGADAALEDAAFLLLDQARILEGESLPDPAAFARRMAAAMEKGLGG